MYTFSFSPRDPIIPAPTADAASCAAASALSTFCLTTKLDTPSKAFNGSLGSVMSTMALSTTRAPAATADAAFFFIIEAADSIATVFLAARAANDESTDADAVRIRN